MIREEHRITIVDIAQRIGVSHGGVINTFRKLDFAKVCARWVPRLLVPDGFTATR